MSVPMKNMVHALQVAMMDMPQVDLPTSHHFADERNGIRMYCRELLLVKGTLAVGKMHLREHFFLVTKGQLMVTDGESEPVTYEAGALVKSSPGTKRAVLALEDCVCMTFHLTQSDDLDEIEKDIIEPDPTSLFDASNKLIDRPATGQIRAELALDRPDLGHPDQTLIEVKP